MTGAPPERRFCQALVQTKEPGLTSRCSFSQLIVHCKERITPAPASSAAPQAAGERGSALVDPGTIGRSAYVASVAPSAAAAAVPPALLHQDLYNYEGPGPEGCIFRDAYEAVGSAAERTW